MVSLNGHKVYLDASTIIYAMEGTAFNLRAGLLLPLDELQLTVVTSRITLLEVLVHPLRNGDSVAEKKFRTFLMPSTHKIIHPVDDLILEKALNLRVEFGFKTPDAIHLATGMLSDCDLYLSADKAWSRAGVSVIDPTEVI